jgi:choline dehydrogenase-like flavoprotein
MGTVRINSHWLREGGDNYLDARRFSSDVVLERAITAYVRPNAHLCGSAKMGRSSDAGAVVDPQGQVFGIDNLWVADASVMPSAPSAPPHLATIMVAEKLAAGFQQWN